MWIDCDITCACLACGGPTEYRVVEDSDGHEDVQHRCKRCRVTRWTDGSDS